MTGPELKTFRKNARFTQAKLAEILGCTANTVARWERGEMTIPETAAKHLKRLSNDQASRVAIAAPVARDSFEEAIIGRLQGHLDAKVLEECAVDLLRKEWPGLAPVIGGKDDGFDGAVAAESGRPFPVIVTTGQSPVKNLRTNLQQAQGTGHAPIKCLFATARRITGATRRALFEAAEGMGVQLLQVYDQAWLAAELYRDATWCKRLLGLPGKLSALTPIPESRNATADEMRGRLSELDELRSSQTDIVVVGAPGSGKTTLFRALTADGALFLVSDDEDATVDAIRQKAPTVIIVDDAQAHRNRLAVLLKIRSQLGAEFRIVAGTWEAYEKDVATQLSHAKKLRLLELDADTVAEIVRHIGVKHNDWIRLIVRQAEGRPGFAATLARACLHGEHKAVFSGEAFFREISETLQRNAAGAESILLGCFALGGKRGYPLDAISGFLQRSKDDIKRCLALLGAAGAIRVSEDGHVSVWPPEFRWVLVRETFFDADRLLDYRELLEHAPSSDDAIESLIGAYSRGAKINIRGLLTEGCSDRLWAKYAACGSLEASEALDAAPGILEDDGAAHMTLVSLPDRVIPKLLNRVEVSSLNEERRDERHPFSIITRWLRHSPRSTNEVIERTRLFVGAVSNWALMRGDVAVAANAVCLALEPAFETSSVDPGRGMTLSLSHGLLQPIALRAIAQLWPDILSVLQGVESSYWSNLLSVVRRWVFPGGIAATTPEMREVMQNHAKRMIGDLMQLSRDHVGVRHRLEEFAERAGLVVEVSNEDDFHMLFPHRGSTSSWRTEYEAHCYRVRVWASALSSTSPDLVVGSISRLEAAAKDAGVQWPRYVDVAYEVLSSTEAPEDWLRALKRHNAHPESLRSFLSRLMDLNCDVDLLLELLEEQRYANVVASHVLEHRAAPAAVLQRVLDLAPTFLSSIEGACIRDAVSQEIAEKLLTHTARTVRVHAAIHLYCSASRTSMLKSPSWRSAILDSAEEAISSSNDYWLSEILEDDLDLATEWLERYVTRDATSDHLLGRIVSQVVHRLSREQRRSVLERLSGERYLGDLVRALVGSDIELFEMLLAAEASSAYHLDPLEGMPNPEWPAKVTCALSSGYSETDAFCATLPTYSWGGSEVELWTPWFSAFEQFASHSSPAVRRVAQLGMQDMQNRITTARVREKREAVRGF